MVALAFAPMTRAIASAPPGWAAQRLALRPAVTSDMPFLRRLYAQTRAVELAGVPWPAAMREQFLDDQFALQHRHYTQQFGSAEFLIVEAEGEPIGRLYLDHASDACHVIDISIEQAWQGKGLGTALLGQVQHDAGSASRAVTLNVNRHNPRARRLYEALGFVTVADEGVYTSMRWPAPS
ncbi:GNAT family N-acetyltransferase [Bacillus sp. NP157]|nr:GNAT family N-acetyltransferase [Bacillus sp. NP157]